MKPSMLHIVLSLLLLLSYGAERLLPCSGPWDVDCASERREATICAAPDGISHCGPEQAHAGTDDPDSPGHHSDAPDDHSDHQCNCPCHAAAIAALLITAADVSEHAPRFSSYSRGLLHTALSPPDHIPIG